MRRYTWHAAPARDQALVSVLSDIPFAVATFGVTQGIRSDVDDCEQFLAGQHAGLLRAAFMLTGDRTAAQDLAQETAVRVLMQWRKVSRADCPQSYARKVLVNAFLGSRRRAWWGEIPHRTPPERPDAGSPYDAVLDQDLLRRALLQLPPRQRAAVVLRYWEDRSEAETAELLGCSTGNVKALASRGLAQLRLLLADAANHDDEGTGTR